MNSRVLYKVTFLNAGKVYELYARRVSASQLWGFTEVADLVFDVNEGMVVDPTEERLRDEFAHTRVLPLPMQGEVRVEEADRRGQLCTREASTRDQAVTPVRMPTHAHRCPPRTRTCRIMVS